VNHQYSHTLEVRFRDCDPMGHVNNAVYLTYLEQARFAHWRALGLAGGEGGGDGPTGPRNDVPGVILARVDIDYRRPAKYGDLLEIRLGIASFGRTSCTYDYEILDARGGVVAAARTVVVSFDYVAGKPVPIPETLKAALSRMLV